MQNNPDWKFDNDDKGILDNYAKLARCIGTCAK
jgi:hypothetical protein